MRAVQEVEHVAVEMAELVEPRMSEPVSPKFATWGWLMMRASAAAVRDNRNEDAEEYMSLARSAAARLGDEPGQVARVQSMLPLGVRGFSASTVAYKDVENAVLLREPERALELAARIPPSEISTTNNRDRHRLDVASAQIATRRPAEAIETLLTIKESSPEWLRRQGYARDLVRQLVEDRRRAYAEQVGTLADHLGVAL